MAQQTGFGVRESKTFGKCILTRDGIGIAHYKLNGTREEVQAMADALNALDKARADRESFAPAVKTIPFPAGK